RGWSRRRGRWASAQGYEARVVGACEAQLRAQAAAPQAGRGGAADALVHAPAAEDARDGPEGPDPEAPARGGAPADAHRRAAWRAEVQRPGDRDAGNVGGAAEHDVEPGAEHGRPPAQPGHERRPGAAPVLEHVARELVHGVADG